MSGRIYEQEVTVPFGHCDYARILYFPRLFHYVHVVMEGFFGSAVGIPYHQLLDKRKLGFPTVHTEADYHRPVPYGDRLRFGLSIPEIGTTSLHMRYRVSGAEDREPRGEVRSIVVCVDMDSFSKRPIPEDIRRVLLEHLEG